MCFRFLSWHFVKWTEWSKCRTLKEMLESWARKAHRIFPFKFYLSKAGGEKKVFGKNKHLLFSTESQRQRTASGSLWNEFMQKDRPWTLVSSSWKQPARIALFFSPCLCSCSLAGKRGKRMSLNPEREERNPTKPSEFLRKAAYLP